MGEAIKPFFYENESLIEIGNKLSEGEYCPIPLRRTFSLIRDFGFGTGYIECELCKKNASQEGELSCSQENCGKRYESCKDYISTLEAHYGCEFISKKCYKISFFKNVISDRDAIRTQPNRSLLAHCMLHVDSFKKNGKDKKILYVPESMISVRERRKNLYFSGNFNGHFKIADANFVIDGHYFSQQNQITNCCAQASIKMALKSYFEDLTVEKINRIVGYDHVSKKGNEGLDPEEFKLGLSKIDGLEVVPIDALTSGNWEFVKFVYHAIESRFPVILLFTHPTSKKSRRFSKKNVRDGHATALIGHTFSKSNWWSYGWASYFNSIKQPIKYLPSVIWCDKFVIQDDNLGSYYRMPISSLRVTGLSSKVWPWLKKIIKVIKQDFLKHILPFSYWPMYAMIAYPKNSVDFLNCIHIEGHAINQMQQYVSERVLNTNYEPVANKQFRELFVYFMNRNQLIARTFVVKKCEYIEYYEVTYQNADMAGDIEALDKYLTTEYLWITEISVPELFWVSRKKIGDIISEPFRYPKNKKQMVKYIRIPSHHCFFLKDFTIERETYEEEDSCYPLLSSKCKTCFG